MIATTYKEPHWYTGIVKTRCSVCHKVVVAYDESTAKNRATDISSRSFNGMKMKAYKGKCGHWHVSTIKRRTYG